MPKITVITPSYNQGKYLEQTMESIHSQNYPNLEHIVIDGASDDNSVKIIKKYENKITYWKSEKDKGQSDALLKGFKRATGEIISWLNSDDWYNKNALWKVGETWNHSQGFDVLHADACFFFENKPENNYFTKYGQCSLERLLEYWSKKRHCNPPQPSVFIRKEILDNVGFVNPEYHFAMDYDLWLRIIRHGFSFTYLPEVLTCYRFHEASKSGSGSLFLNFYKEWHRVFLINVETLPFNRKVFWKTKYYQYSVLKEIQRIKNQFLKSMKCFNSLIVFFKTALRFFLI